MVAHPQAPCGRCFRLCLECKQPARKPYARRSRSAGKEEEAADERDEDDKEGSGSAGKGGETKRQRRGAGMEVDATPLLELIIARNDPGGERREKCRFPCNCMRPKGCVLST